MIEYGPSPFLAQHTVASLYEYTARLLLRCGYTGAGTVEFLLDGSHALSSFASYNSKAEAGNVYFLEVNPRIQVEHTVTEETTGEHWCHR